VEVLELADDEMCAREGALNDLAILGVSVNDLSVADLSRLAGVLVLLRSPGPALPLLED
jgi:hypothetical protein